MYTAGEDVTIACVLRSGGEYEPKHVIGLLHQLKRHMQAPFKLVCLTDCDFKHPEIQCVPLLHGWPGWWSKLELFRVFKRDYVFYMDLDTMITGDITDIVMPKHGFWGLRDFNHPGSFASGLMAWDGNHSYLYERFAEDTHHHTSAHKVPQSWGDQGYIHSALRVPPMAFQDHYGNRIISWKKHVLPHCALTAQPSIVCFHGKPRPWQAVPTWPELDFSRSYEWMKK